MANSATGIPVYKEMQDIAKEIWIIKVENFLPCAMENNNPKIKSIL